MAGVRYLICSRSPDTPLSCHCNCLVILVNRSDYFRSHPVLSCAAESFGVRVSLRPQLDEYDDSVENNFVDEGFALQIGGTGREAIFPEPIVLSPGTITRVGIVKEESTNDLPKFPMFDPECSERVDLPITNGMHAECYNLRDSLLLQRRTRR